ncbi:winged helix-turn-helix transcriptional regulator [Candidatus Bathyarchaeota archaeon]|nr:winged helix-turn-helix transcriptional regulator [Candidatus Bathyarchaeota archaeon]
MFKSEVRRRIIKLLLQLEWRSLSDIAEKLENDYSLKITLPGLLKHMRQLEETGIVRHESGVFAKKPDARKTVYMLEGKERVEKLLMQLEENVGNLLNAGVIFSKTAKKARIIQRMEPHMLKKEIDSFESLLAKCESKKVNSCLTEDEKKKVKLWRMMMQLLKEK